MFSATVLTKSTTKPFSQHSTSCPVPGMQEEGHQWKGPWWWAPHEVQLMWKDSEEDLYIATIAWAVYWKTLQITSQDTCSNMKRKSCAALEINNFTTRSIEWLLWSFLLSHHLAQQMVFTQLWWNCRFANFNFPKQIGFDKLSKVNSWPLENRESLIFTST